MRLEAREKKGKRKEGERIGRKASRQPYKPDAAKKPQQLLINFYTEFFISQTFFFSFSIFFLPIEIQVE